MNKPEDIAEKFECLLDRNKNKSIINIYRNQGTLQSLENKTILSASDIISNVTSTLKTIQIADNFKIDRNKLISLEKHKKSLFVPVNLLPESNETSKDNQQANKFETQCVLDTQLMDIIDSAEASLQIQGHKGVIQEFETSFCDLEKDVTIPTCSNQVQSDSKKSKDSKAVDKLENNLTVIDFKKAASKIQGFTITGAKNNGTTVSKSNLSPKVINENIEKHPDLEIKLKQADMTQFFNESIDLDNNVERLGVVIEEMNGSTSPVLHAANNKGEAKVSQTLVFNLDTFENFEKITIPLVCSQELDFEDTDKMLCSQILGKVLPNAKQDKCKVNVKKDKLSIPGTKKFNEQEAETVYPLTEVASYASNIVNSKNYVSLKYQEKSDETLKDEILFSSDEESDYNHKSIIDMPFTCALESSFYTNNSDILDKTMYVGFQTASNKSIQVCTDSYEIAKTILNDDHNIENPIPTFTKMVESYELGMPTFERSREKELISVINNANLQNFHCLTIDQHNASLNDTVHKIQENKLSLVSNTTRLPCDIIVTENVDVKSTRQANFEGFKTASNKIIKLTKKSLLRVKEVFQDIDLDKPLDSHPTSKSTTPNFVSNKILSSNYVNLQTSFRESQEDCNFIKNNMAYQENCMNDQVDPSKFEICKDIQNSFKGNNIASKEKTLETTRIFFPDIKSCEIFQGKEEIVDESLHPQLVGFKTASGKQIKISETAHAISKRMLQDIECIGKLVHKTTKLVSADGRKSTKPMSQLSSDSEMNAQDTLFESFNDINLDMIGIKNHEEMEIAKGVKTKTMSSEKQQSLKFAKSLNSDTTSIQPVALYKEPLEKLKQNLLDIDKEVPIYPSEQNEPVIEIIGFKTASNKEIKISEDNLAKMKNIFKDININENSLTMKSIFETSHLPLESTFENDQTATHKNVAVPEEEKTKHIVHETNFNDNYFLEEKANAKPRFKFKGFQTASNKKVTVTDNALAKTKSMFQDIFSEDELFLKHDNPSKTKMSFMGFQTAINKKVSISEEALTKTKSIFDDINTNHVLYAKLTTKSNFEGFQTASNKNVAVTEDALAKTKTIFQENSNFKCKTILDVENNKMGFQTANNSEFLMSENALAKTKDTFRDLGTNDKFINESKVTQASTFQGFQTASNKKVTISKEALAKTKIVFQDIEHQLDSCFQASKKEQDSLLKINKISTVSQNEGKHEIYFKTDNNKVAISPISQKIIISETENCKKTRICDKKYITADSEVDKYVDMELIKDFEKTVNTEDFYKSPKATKRSSSPILSCPRAKKKKCFKTPYKLVKFKEIPVNNLKITENIEKPFVFQENYKTVKILTLKDINQVETSNIIEDCDNCCKDIMKSNLKFDNLLQFEFTPQRNNISHTKLTVNDIKDLFVKCVDKKIVPEGWLDNHLKLILWKLLSYEIRYPKSMCNVCNTENVMNQLKYRYDRELHRVERPALRKILEKDEASARTIILCVVSIIVNGEIDDFTKNADANVELILTDGWYCIKASLDKMLSKLVFDGRIYVGSKLVTHGAELINCEQGLSPWEDTSKVRLKIFGNSTRPAKWDARLGFHANSSILTPLSSVKVEGGKISKIRVFITRVYPTLYVEKFGDGSTVTRSERLEHIYQTKYESEREAQLEKVYEEIQREMSDQDSQDSESVQESGSGKRKQLDSGSQVAKLMKRSKDPMEFKANLTASQQQLLNDYTSHQRDRMLQEIQSKVQERISRSGLNLTRNVVTLLKIRIAGSTQKDGGFDTCRGMMSIWRPNDAILELLQEGAWVDMLNVFPTAVRNSEIQISAGRQSTFSRAKVKEEAKLSVNLKTFMRNCTQIKEIVRNPIFKTDYNEIDTIGFIFLIEPSNADFDKQPNNNQPFQNVYLSDTEKNMICVNFWGGIKKFGFENIIGIGEIVACTNLQKRIGNTRKSIPQFRVTEFTYFTKTPKNHNTRNMIDELVKKFNGLDKRKYCNDCKDLKNNFNILKYKNNDENISPYRFNNVDVNLSKHKMFIDSPLTEPKVSKNEVDDMNLTGLDFESTFKQRDTQDMSPELLLRKKRASEKIAKLKMYGEPPPLSPMQIINKSNHASKPFKSPLISTNSTTNSTSIPKGDENLETTNQKKINQNYYNVTRVSNNNLPEKQNTFTETCDAIKSDNLTSPIVSLNRTYVKRISNVNPVKLNFSDSVAEVSDVVNIDNFAEEFDSSPPLSLD